MSHTVRPIGRAVLVAGVLVLGAAAAMRLPVAFLPAWSLPELRVDLALPEASDLEGLTRRWILPLESSIRAAGDVRGLAGEVSGSGGNFRVRFSAGVDVERKVARLESELAGLRRRLPPGARLDVWPVGQGAGDESAIVWLGADSGDSRVDQSLIEALRDLPEVRSVEVAGQARHELRVRARPGGVPAVTLGAAIDDGLRFRRLGEARAGGRRLPVVVADRRHQSVGDLHIRRGPTLVPLRAVADVGLRREDPPWTAHLDGARGLVLLISREIEASPLALDRSLRRTFGTFGVGDQARSLIDEAAPLRELLTRLALGLALATVVSAVVFGRLFGAGAALWQALALPAALAAALNAVWLAGLPLDVTTLPVIAAGVGCALFVTAFRIGGSGEIPPSPPISKGGTRGISLGPSLSQKGGHAFWASAAIVVSVLVLPVAVSLAGGDLAPLVAAPVRAFVVAVVAGLVALWLLPRPAVDRLPPRWITRLLKWTLRNPWTVVLSTVVAGYLLLVLSGRALEPRTGDLSPAIGDLAVRLRFPDGATADQAEAQVAAVERHLDEVEEITGHWSVFNRGRGTVVATVRRRDRPLSRLATLARRLQAQLGTVGASARVMPLGAPSGGESVAQLTESLEDRPETDDESTYYRFILRHTDVEALRLAHAAVMDRLATVKYAIWHEQIHTDWARPSTRMELVPRPGVSVEEASVAARAVATGASMPFARPLSADRDLRLRVMDPRSPRTRDQVTQRAALLGLQASASGSAIVPAAFLEAREVVASPTIKRQSGRFALPMTVNIAGSQEALRKVRRASVDRALAGISAHPDGLAPPPLPAGTAVERPELNPTVWSRERLTLLRIAGALPLLFFALAVFRLNAFGVAVAALVPPILGAAAAAPFIQATSGRLDELTLLLLAAALAGSFPIALEAAAAASPSASAPLAAGATYRWLARRALGFAAVVPTLFVLLVVPGLGLDNDRHAWVLPLRVAGVAATVAVLASLFCLPVLLRTAQRYVGPLSGGRRLRAGRRAPAGQSAWRSPASDFETPSYDDAVSDSAARQPDVGAHGRAPAAAGRRNLVLAARNLTKNYGDGFRALHAVSFQLEPGIVGLLGPNGAGKTTLLRLLCGLLEPSRGQVRFRGVPLGPANLADYRHLVGFLPQGFNAYEGFTGADFLDYWAIERGLIDRKERRREVERVLAQVGLDDTAGRKVRDYSGGMRRRIGIARALLGSPPIVIVDEPTTGLDVESRNRLRETLLAVAGERIILFSTHIASDVAAAASRILILDRGRLVFDGPALDLIAAARGRVFEALIEDHDLPDFSHRFRVTTRVRSLDGLKVRAIVYDDQEPAGDVVEPNLEEAYLAMIGAPDRGEECKSGRSGSLLDLEAWDSRKS